MTLQDVYNAHLNLYLQHVRELKAGNFEGDTEALLTASCESFGAIIYAATGEAPLGGVARAFALNHIKGAIERAQQKIQQETNQED